MPQTLTKLYRAKPNVVFHFRLVSRRSFYFLFQPKNNRSEEIELKLCASSAKNKNGNDTKRNDKRQEEEEEQSNAAEIKHQRRRRSLTRFGVHVYRRHRCRVLESMSIRMHAFFSSSSLSCFFFFQTHKMVKCFTCVHAFADRSMKQVVRVPLLLCSFRSTFSSFSSSSPTLFFFFSFVLSLMLCRSIELESRLVSFDFASVLFHFRCVCFILSSHIFPVSNIWKRQKKKNRELEKRNDGEEKNVRSSNAFHKCSTEKSINSYIMTVISSGGKKKRRRKNCRMFEFRFCLFAFFSFVSRQAIRNLLEAKNVTRVSVLQATTRDFLSSLHAHKPQTLKAKKKKCDEKYEKIFFHFGIEINFHFTGNSSIDAKDANN